MPSVVLVCVVVDVLQRARCLFATGPSRCAFLVIAAGSPPLVLVVRCSLFKSPPPRRNCTPSRRILFVLSSLPSSIHLSCDNNIVTSIRRTVRMIYIYEYSMLYHNINEEWNEWHVCSWILIPHQVAAVYYFVYYTSFFRIFLVPLRKWASFSLFLFVFCFCLSASLQSKCVFGAWLPACPWSPHGRQGKSSQICTEYTTHAILYLWMRGERSERCCCPLRINLSILVYLSPLREWFQSMQQLKLLFLLICVLFFGTQGWV